MKLEINYTHPEFYMSDYRKRFKIVKKVQVNKLKTMENIKDFYWIHLFDDGYIGLFNNNRNTYLKPIINDKKDNYFKYSLRAIDDTSKSVYMHRLIGLAFIDGYKKGYFIDHIDSDKQNNLIENLEWITHTENTQRAVKNNLGVGRPKVEKKIKPKLSLLQISENSSKGRNGLTFKQVESIFYLKEKGYSENAIAKKFGVSQACINQILNGKRWKSHPAGILYREKLKSV